LHKKYTTIEKKKNKATEKEKKTKEQNNSEPEGC
jgi:hypothetical protein